MEVICTVAALVRSFNIIDEGPLKVGPVVNGAWWKLIQPCVCQSCEAEGYVSESVANVTSRHVLRRKANAEPVVRL